MEAPLSGISCISTTVVKQTLLSARSCVRTNHVRWFPVEQRNSDSQERLRDIAKRQQIDAQLNLEALAELDAMLASPLPTSPQEREQFFISQLKVAEDFMGRGPAFYEASARCFFRVLQIYPYHLSTWTNNSDPMQLMMVFEQSLPQPVFALIMDLMASEMKNQGMGQATEQPLPDISLDELVE